MRTLTAEPSLGEMKQGGKDWVAHPELRVWEKVTREPTRQCSNFKIQLGKKNSLGRIVLHWWAPPLSENMDR